MSFTISPSDDGDYLLVDVVGEITRDISAGFIGAMFEIGTKLGIRCFLIDVTGARNAETTIERVHTALDEPPEVSPPHYASRASVLVEIGDHSHDFFVAFARSQGIDIEIFWDRANAIEHLREAAPRLNTRDSVPD